MLSEFAKVFEWKVSRLQIAHLHNAARALSSPCLAKISFVIFDSLAWVHNILTTVMMRIVVDKSTYHAKPHSIC